MTVCYDFIDVGMAVILKTLFRICCQNNSVMTHESSTNGHKLCPRKSLRFLVEGGRPRLWRSKQLRGANHSVPLWKLILTQYRDFHIVDVYLTLYSFSKWEYWKEAGLPRKFSWWLEIVWRGYGQRPILLSDGKSKSPH